MLVIGFMAFDQIPKHYFMGDGSMVFYPTDGDPVSIHRSRFYHVMLSILHNYFRNPCTQCQQC